MNKDQREIQRKLRILRHAEETGHVAKWHANRTSPEREEKVLYLRRKCHLGAMRVVWYLERYHNIKISDATVSRILRRHGLNRLPRGPRMRKVHTKRYQKQVPGHHIQMDVKFLAFIGNMDEKVRRFQYTAINDATRVRALNIYEKHTQTNAISFVDHIIGKFPFRIREIRTDNGHEFQAKFHWHVRIGQHVHPWGQSGSTRIGSLSPVRVS